MNTAYNTLWILLRIKECLFSQHNSRTLLFTDQFYFKEFMIIGRQELFTEIAIHSYKGWRQNESNQNYFNKLNCFILFCFKGSRFMRFVGTGAFLGDPFWGALPNSNDVTLRNQSNPFYLFGRFRLERFPTVLISDLFIWRVSLVKPNVSIWPVLPESWCQK